MNGLPNNYSGFQEHNTGKTGCMAMEPDSTVNFFHHSNQSRMYHPGQNEIQQYTCYYSERHVDEGLKPIMPAKAEVAHPATPEKFHPQRTPTKSQSHSNDCAAIPISPPPPHQPTAFNEVNEKIPEDASAFNAMHHHPTYHNNNQSWPVQTTFQQDHQPPSHPSHVGPHQEQNYPPLGSFSYPQGHTSTYHETHYSQHVPHHHVNSPGYNEIYNQHH